MDITTKIDSLEMLSTMMQSFGLSGRTGQIGELALSTMCSWRNLYTDVPTLPDGYTLPEGVEQQHLYTCWRDDRYAVAEKLASELYWVHRENFRRGYDARYAMPRWTCHLPQERFRELWWHFPHKALKQDGGADLIAYTPNHEKGKRDQQVRVSVGRYLSKFYSDVMSPEQIRSIVNMSKPLELRFGTQEEHFVQAYEAVVDSCMGGPNRFDRKRHPARVYATPDFKIAALVPQGTPDGDFTTAQARAVVFQDELVVRVYGPECNALRDRLEEAGIRYDYDGGFDGGRLKKILFDGGSRAVMPYIDGTADHTSDCGDERYWYLSDCGTFDCCYTSGYIDITPMATCDCCGEAAPEDELNYSEFEEASYCDNCIDNDRVVSAYRGDYRGRRETVLVRDHNAIRIDGDWYVDDSESLTNLGLEFCEQSEEWDLAENFVTLEDGARASTRHNSLVLVRRESWDGDEDTYVLAHNLSDYDALRVIYRVRATSEVDIAGFWLPADPGEADQDGEPHPLEVAPDLDVGEIGDDLVMARLDRFARMVPRDDIRDTFGWAFAEASARDITARVRSMVRYERDRVEQARIMERAQQGLEPIVVAEETAGSATAPSPMLTINLNSPAYRTTLADLAKVTEYVSDYMRVQLTDNSDVQF